MIVQTEFILYVSNQQASKAFYSGLLDLELILDVPGMTEFQLSENVKLRFMTEEGIKKIIQNVLPDTSLVNGIPRCEFYLKLPGIKRYMQREVELKAVIVNHFADLDGHVIAFAETII